MTALFIDPIGLPDALHRTLVELGMALGKAGAECDGMTEHWQHYAYVDHLRSRSLDAKFAMSDEEERNDFLRNNHGQTKKLEHEIRLFGGWAMGAARVFAIDYCEAVARLRWAANKCLEVRDLRPAIDVDAARRVVAKLDERLPSLEAIRNAAAHGAGYTLDRPRKKTIGQEGLEFGLHMPGGVLAFSMSADVAIASFGERVHRLPVTRESVDELLALKAELFTALVVWPGFTGERRHALTLELDR